MDKKSFGGKEYFSEEATKVISANYQTGIKKGSELKTLNNININFDVDDSKDYYVLEGYANNKLIPGTNEPAVDSYGDIPTGENVYDLTRMLSNPIMLANHDTDSHKIMGNFIYLKEDKQGLKFVAVLRDLEDVFHPETKDTISAWKTGFGRALSIGGRWYYDIEQSNPDRNEYALVKAIIHETSGVAVGADSHALVQRSDNQNEGKKTLEELVEYFLNSNDEKHIEEIQKLIKENKTNERKN